MVSTLRRKLTNFANEAIDFCLFLPHRDRHTVSGEQRWEGALFFLLYLVYVSYLVLDSIGSEAAPIIGSIMVWVVLPALAAAVIAVFAHKLGVCRWVRSKFSRFVAKRPRKKPHRAE